MDNYDIKLFHIFNMKINNYFELLVIKINMNNKNIGL